MIDLLEEQSPGIAKDPFLILVFSSSVDIRIAGEADGNRMLANSFPNMHILKISETEKHF